MSTLPPPDVPAIFWIDGAGQQQGPEPLATVIERIAHDQIPSTTPVWWQGAVNWSPFNSNAELAAALTTRLTPAPAPAPAPEPQVATQSPFAATTSSPFSSPAPSESTSVFGSPASFEQPVTFEAPVTSPFEAPATIEIPAAAATFDAAAPEVTDPTPTFETASTAVTYDAPTTGFDAPAAADAPVAVEIPVAEAAPVVSDVPEVIVPDEPVVAVPSLQLGDAAELESTFASLTERSSAFDAEVARAAALDNTIAGLVRQALGELGFSIDESLTSDDYHSFRLSEPGGAVASLAIQRVPAAIDVAAATERPIACFVDRAGRASVGLFVGDYLTDDGTDQALFTKHLASVVNAAGTAS